VTVAEEELAKNETLPDLNPAGFSALFIKMMLNPGRVNYPQDKYFTCLHKNV
jgi:hypothetical protein